MMGVFNQSHLIRQIDLFTLRLFLSVVEEGQIGRAATRENIAPSTATKRIQDLEAIAGIQLLARTPKGVAPSPAGAVLARYARSILTSIDELRSEIAAFTVGARGKIALVSARSIISPFLTPELKGYSREFPMVELAVSEVDNRRIVEMVARGDADVGVFAMEQGLELHGVDVAPYRRDRMIAIVPRSSPLSERTKVSFAELLTENVIALESLMGIFESAAQRAGARLEPRYCVRSAGLAASLVGEGIGVAVLPECLLSEEARGKVARIELGESWATRSLHVATARGRPLSPAAEAFVRRLLTAGANEAANARSA